MTPGWNAEILIKKAIGPMTFLYFRTDHILDMRRIVWGATHEFMTPALPGLNEVEQLSRINVGHLVADQIGEETVRLR
jgi:hypothetical protein